MVQGRSFPTTRWSIVIAASETDSPSGDALSSLCQLYWPAVYAYVRYRGHNREEAEDLTQGYFAKLLERNFVRQADRERGRFRTFLLSSLKNYLANEWDRTQAQKRGGDQQILSLDFVGAEQELQIEPVDAATPETIFVRRWARTLVDRVLEQLRNEMVQTGQGERFDRLKFVLTGSEPSVPYQQLAVELGLSENALKVSVHRMRQRFGRLLRKEVAHTVEDEAAVAEELRFLIEALG